MKKGSFGGLFLLGEGRWVKDKGYVSGRVWDREGL